MWVYMLRGANAHPCCTVYYKCRQSKPQSTTTQDAGFVFGFQPIRCKFKPTAAMLQTCEESGTDLAQLVRRRKRREDQVNKVPGAQPVVGGTGAQSALGRVVGSLCVVTARDGDAESAMLASWISQVGGFFHHYDRFVSKSVTSNIPGVL